VTDLSATVAPKSDQINADDLIAGPRTIRVTRVTGNEGNPEQPVNIFFEGDMGKPYRPCKSMRRVLIAVWGADGNAYAGRSMTLYRDPAVTFGGMQVGGIRISHMSGIDKPMTMALTASKANRKPYTVKPLSDAPAPSADPVAAQTRARAAASRGTAAFTAWWNSDAGKADRAHCRSIMDELKRLCAEGDATPHSDGGPWGLPPADGPHWTDTAPDDGFPGSGAWAAGEAAFRAGHPARTCPHEQGTQDAADWLSAWHGARRAAE
jgi:hypothetical protein